MGGEGEREGEGEVCERDMSIFAAERKAEGVTSFGDTPAKNKQRNSTEFHTHKIIASL